jgi:hypothetical protein
MICVDLLPLNGDVILDTHEVVFDNGHSLERLKMTPTGRVITQLPYAQQGAFTTHLYHGQEGEIRLKRNSS